MTTRVDVQLIEGLGLPYAAGAEAALLDGALDPHVQHRLAGFVAQFPGQTLLPLFDELPVEQLADLVDGVRVSGDEPPNPFVWFTLTWTRPMSTRSSRRCSRCRWSSSPRRGRRCSLPDAISYGTNPRAGIGQTFQIRPAPLGVDAIYAWQIAGGTGDGARVGDIEQGWRLDHEELLTRRSPGDRCSARHREEIDHGTGVAGIVVGADNGVGAVGIVPNAELELFSRTRANGSQNFAGAIAVAARQLDRGRRAAARGGGQLLRRPPNDGPDILVEFDPAVQLQIRLAVGRGITVIEPAGNGGIDLDAFPFLAHTRPGSPTFSGAIVVGAATDTDPVSGTWLRRSSFGSRVDCFAADTQIQSPRGTATDAYREFRRHIRRVGDRRRSRRFAAVDDQSGQRRPRSFRRPTCGGCSAAR